MSTGFNPNDPATWDQEPVDAEMLKALDAETKEAKPDVAEDAKPEPEQVAPADEPAAAGITATDPEWVLTADGKHALPYQYLAEARGRAREAEQRAAELTAQLESLRTPPESSQQTAGTPTSDDLAAEIADLRARYEQSKEEDEDLARAYLGTLKALERQQQMEQQLAAIGQQFKSMADQRAEAEQATLRGDVEAALQRNPLLQEMTTDPIWYERARQVEASLAQQPESAYQQAPDWDGRFQAVVAAVQAIYGPHPAAAALTPVTAKSGRATKAIEALDDPIPPSMSALGSGEAPSAGDEWEALARLSPSELLGHLTSLKDKGRLGDALGRIS